tara:strand:+ start:132 stop:308 length:177 start_codon:yes stop_codon:yes gene_type:complete
MTLKEYLDLKATGYHFDDFNQEITVNKPDGGTDKIQLGALQGYLDRGYSVNSTDDVTA